MKLGPTPVTVPEPEVAGRLAIFAQPLESAEPVEPVEPVEPLKLPEPVVSEPKEPPLSPEVPKPELAAKAFRLAKFAFIRSWRELPPAMPVVANPGPADANAGPASVEVTCPAKWC
jgi:hypothetical protein